MDNILDHVVVQGQRYDIVSPTAFGDYIETIGSACINPDGYAKGSTFLARLGNEQFYYEATAAITQGSAILEGTNCKKTTVTGREAELTSEIETLGETVDSLNEALTNVESDIAPIEDSTKYSTSYTKGQQFIRGGKLYTVTASSVNSSIDVIIKPTSGYNAELAYSVTEQIYTALAKNNLYIEVTGTTEFQAINALAKYIYDNSILTDLYTTVSGYMFWSGHTVEKFEVCKTAATIYKIFIYSDDYAFVGKYAFGTNTLTLYRTTMTQVTS